MEIRKLDHVNVRTAALENMISWYTEVLGMRQGERPNFPFPGAWMYVGDVAAVHLVGVDGDPGFGSETDLKLEHFAFSATGGAKFESKLKAKGVDYKRSDIPEMNLYQINLWDADGNHIHLDFPEDD
jgi:catechol 2,3-dioxygenase-like lactoylglutathione lyase family enzyme|tara:strand:+ start:67 stop:447 length:381 start_codon:yes stop_codon:yes gene_type:complete